MTISGNIIFCFFWPDLTWDSVFGTIVAMTERAMEQSWVAGVFGREQSADNLGRKAAATIYHSIFLHTPVHDSQLLEGIKKNLVKLISDEDLKHLEAEHYGKRKIKSI